MTLRPDQWDLLTTLAQTPSGWVAEGPTDEGRRRRATAVRELAPEGLCELASDQLLQKLRDHDGRRPAWAARILPDGQPVLRYRELHIASATGELPPRPPVPAGIDLTGSEVDVLRRIVALAPLLPSARTQALADALAHAMPGTPGNHWVVPANAEHLDTIEAALRLQTLTGASTSTSYHCSVRKHRNSHEPPVRLTHDAPGT
ncbi:DUF6417 family protein [Kitasatospora sp. NBC_01250]|uniref:hypothetical protein n=1 Tax=Kitasatospora sp. NBC_01250 TaxID=2903571 RepID=UPI002E2F5897|nr:hypothetical protein [Kitasatospora sp. NBC_01250]